MNNALFILPCLTTLFTTCGIITEPLNYGPLPEGSKIIGELDAVQQQLTRFAKKLDELAAEVQRIALEKDTEFTQKGTNEEPDNEALMESLRIQYEGLRKLSGTATKFRDLMLNLTLDRSVFEGHKILIAGDGKIVAVPLKAEASTFSFIHIVGGQGGDVAGEPLSVIVGMLSELLKRSNPLP